MHLWLGLISGLVVFILGTTGAIYAFQDEIREVVYRDRLYVNVAPGQPRLPLGQLAGIAKMALGEKYKISRAELSQKKGKTYMFRALKINKKAFSYWDYYVYYHKVYLNPYTGEVILKENAKWEFFSVVLGLHRTLMLGETGHVVIRWSVVCFVVLLLTGLYLWWPKKWKYKQLKNSFKIKWNAKFKRLNYDLHNVSGFYTFLFLMVISLTGLMWSFELTSEKKQIVLSDTTKVADPMPVDLIFKEAQSAAPGAAYFLYNFPAAKSGTVNVSAYFSENSLYQKLQFKYDRYSGKQLVLGEAFEKLSIGSKITAMNYDLHTGSALGLFGKIMAFFSGLIAAGLPVTGLIMWLQRRKRKLL